MTGLPLILVFILAIVVMIIMISKFKIHPFISIMCISLVLGIIAGIPIVDRTLEDGTKVSGLASVIGQGFSGTFSGVYGFLWRGVVCHLDHGGAAGFRFRDSG